MFGRTRWGSASTTRRVDFFERSAFQLNRDATSTKWSSTKWSSSNPTWTQNKKPVVHSPPKPKVQPQEENPDFTDEFCCAVPYYSENE